MATYQYEKDLREAKIRWIKTNKIDVVWYAHLDPIIKSFEEKDVLKTGEIVSCCYGKSQKFYEVEFLGLLDSEY